MITQFKMFESKEYYKIGDYILLDMDLLRKNDQFDIFKIKDDMAIITEIQTGAGGEDMYEIDFYDGTNTEFSYVIYGEIKRHLSPDEINLFKIKKDADKYNL